MAPTFCLGYRCEEEYCTRCFRDRHSKGNMRLHTTYALIYWTEGMRRCHEAAAVAVVRAVKPLYLDNVLPGR